MRQRLAEHPDSLKLNKNMNTQELKERWISLLRMKAKFEHNARKSGEVVASPSIDDICNEMEAFFTGLECHKLVHSPKQGANTITLDVNTGSTGTQGTPSVENYPF